MGKGKPWTQEQEKQLESLVVAGKSLKEIVVALQKSKAAVRMKLQRLGLEVVNQVKKNSCSTSSLSIPDDLPSVELQLRVLAGAIMALRSGGLDKTDVIRLRGLISGVKQYNELYAEYVDYRGIERKVESALEWLRKLDEERKDVDR